MGAIEVLDIADSALMSKRSRYVLLHWSLLICNSSIIRKITHMEVSRSRSATNIQLRNHCSAHVRRVFGMTVVFSKEPHLSVFSYRRRYLYAALLAVALCRHINVIMEELWVATNNPKI